MFTCSFYVLCGLVVQRHVALCHVISYYLFLFVDSLATWDCFDYFVCSILV